MSVTSSQGMIHGLPVAHKIEQEALRHEQCIDEFLDLSTWSVELGSITAASSCNVPRLRTHFVEQRSQPSRSLFVLSMGFGVLRWDLMRLCTG